MRILIVEDDFVSRQILIKILSELGVCDVAVNGKEAVEAFDMAHGDGQPYSLLCLDIMMPEMDGQEVLKKIRKKEEEKGIHILDRIKVIMITALQDKDNIMQAFREGCESYLVKPIDKEKILAEISKLGLLQQSE